MSKQRSSAAFGWKDPRIGGSAQVAGEELQRLERVFGAVTPETVVDSARAPESVLHRYFEWDDSLAAEEYRKEQARSLLRAVLMASPGDTQGVRAFVLVEDDDGTGYVGTIRALSDDAMREQVLTRALTELRAFRAKYKDLKELAAVLTAIEEVA